MSLSSIPAAHDGLPDCRSLTDERDVAVGVAHARDENPWYEDTGAEGRSVFRTVRDRSDGVVELRRETSRHCGEVSQQELGRGRRSVGPSFRSKLLVEQFEEIVAPLAAIRWWSTMVSTGCDNERRRERPPSEGSVRY